jgi:hypothetical protein
MTDQNGIAQGDALTSETFANFVTRLRHHCEGSGVEWHCTADAIFTVQAKRRVAGIDKDYTDNWIVYCDESEWFSPQSYWDDLDDKGREYLDAKAKDDSDCSFLEMGEPEQWRMLGKLQDHTVTGYQEEWEHVNSHFTKEAAEAFIARKKHDYRLGLRVYVDAQSHCWEWNAIKDALIDGRLVFSEEKGGAA